MARAANAFRTPLSRARGLGAAKHGAGHFIAERVSGLALVPLILWAAFSGPMLAQGDFASAVTWLAHPVNAVLAGLLVVVGFFHLRLQMQVVIEDYIYGFLAKTSALLANLFVCVLGASLGLFAILKVALLSGAF